MAQGSYILINQEEKLFQAYVSCRVNKENGWHIAECPELQMTDQGKTFRAAIDNLRDMIILSLTESIESGNIDGMLIESGFRETDVPVPTLRIYSRTVKGSSTMYPLHLEKTFTSRPVSSPLKPAAV